ncbi:DUF6255 family natural product biosynthesis protein [Streptomyces albireticuli]|uniref:DUF6255 family natural product biosynthesis protein n=1 Tax=Streptomyces albireticuli TaxID=1940 RepID=UPI003690A901
MTARRTPRGCTHRAGWAPIAAGASRCAHCGTRRFTDYAALLLPEAPQAVTLSAAERWAADRAAAGRVLAALTLTHRRVNYSQPDSICRKFA